MTKIPERMCVACRVKKEKKDLVRLVVDNGNVVLDQKKQLSGRGFYLCNDEQCFQLLKKKRVLNRLLSRAVSDEEYDLLKESIYAKK